MGTMKPLLKVLLLALITRAGHMVSEKNCGFGMVTRILIRENCDDGIDASTISA